MTKKQEKRQALVLLTTGSLVGILLGVVVALNNQSRTEVNSLPANAIAIVNGRTIPEEEYSQALALLAGDKRTALTDADRAYVLNRLIEEELLVQYGIKIGLVDSDRSVRKTITQAMLASIVAEATSEQPSESALRTFYKENLASFIQLASSSSGHVAADGKTMQPPVFEEVREQVEEAYLRRTRDEALQEYLQWLRDEAQITLAPQVSQ